MRALLAFALALLSGPAGAASDKGGLDVVEYNSDVEASFYTPDAVVSADGYHFTTVVVSKDGERVYQDAKKIAQGPLGTFTREGYSSRRIFHGSLSRDGKVAAHAMFSPDDEGRPSYRLAVNGAPAGRRFRDILEVRVSPGGGNLAFTAQSPEGKYLVITPKGAGPSVDSPEKLLGVSDSGVAYTLNFGGRDWVYRDHKALTYGEYSEVAVNADLSRIAGVTAGGVEVDGKPLGRWSGPSGLRYTAAGDLVFLARSSPRTADASVDLVVVNGRESALPAFKPGDQEDHPASVRPDGVSFLVDDAGTYGHLRLGGKAMPELGEVMPAAEWVAFSPSGRRWAVVARRGNAYELAVDGKLFAPAPLPLKNGRIIFDSETELHYLGSSMGRVTLVCAALEGEVSSRSACARHGEAMGKKDALVLKPLEAAPTAR